MSEETSAAEAPETNRRWFLVAFLIRYRSHVTAVLTLVLVCLVGMAIYKLTDEVNYDAVVENLIATPPSYIGYAIFWTALSFGFLVLYDRNALEFVNRPLPLPQVALTSFVAYAVGNTAGFGALSGGAIRYRAYSRMGLAPDEIARIIAFVTISFIIGVALIATLSLLAVAEEASAIVGLSPLTLRLTGAVVLVIFVVIFILGLRKPPLRLGVLSLNFPDSRTLTRQFLVILGDIAASASVLYVLLPETAISWPAFVCIFSIALGLALISHVPAGIGVFEAVIIAAMGGTANIDAVLGSLVMFRLVYYVLPLIVAIVALTIAEFRELAGTPMSQDLARSFGRVAAPLLATFSVVLGVMMIFASVTPTPFLNISILEEWLPLPIVEGAHFLSSLIGLLLVVAARGLSQRLDGAWWTTLVAAAAGLLLSLLKSVALVEAALLALLLLGLISSRRLFKRRASLIRQALTTTWLVAVAVICIGAIVILFFVYRNVEYSHDLWWQFEFEADAPRSLRAVLGLVIASSVIAVFSLLRPAVARLHPPKEAEIAEAAEIVRRQHSADANLVRTGDKSIMFSPDRDAFIMYGRQGRSLVAFLDPIGAAEARAELVWQFVETARSSGCRAVFYQASPALLPALADAGLQAYKLGEEAVVDLARFDLKGGRWANLRQTAAKAERDGLTFEMIDMDGLSAILPDLQRVSDEWLAQHNAKEKGFSLGTFTEDYMLSQPVSVLRLEGEIVAFANMLLTDESSEASIDLMRFSEKAPKGAMDLLFVSILKAMRDKGVAHFNLGMAPLAGLSRREVAPFWDRVANTFFEHSERYYNFKGLRAFKNKFHPKWQPRYLAVSGGLNPLLALLDATLLIGGGLRGVVRK